MSLPFRVYTDDSNYHMGILIIQQKRPVAYWSPKLTETQLHTMEKALLSIFMVIGAFHSMLLDAVLFTYTNHKHLKFATLNCCRIIPWCSYMEMYGPIILYHKYHCIYTFFTATTLQNFANSSVGECSCCPLQFHFYWPWDQWWPWSPWVLSQLTLTTYHLPSITENNHVDLKWIYFQKGIIY